MAETAPAATPAKAPKKKASSKPKKKTGPSVSDLIVKAVSASKERHGLSLAGLKKALTAGGYDVEKNNARVKLSVKSLVSKGSLVQTKGTGASGSFKINKKQAEAKEKATKKKAAPKKKPAAKKSTAAKKVKKPAVKKPAAAKKATRSPKKAKPAAKPKKAAKSPKKVKVSKPKVVKTKTVKKAAPKKK
ncbi:histone H1-like [Erpetoichthys calabaricus]|uniref:Histone H1 n=1 Tax=Erpetoichthys calabaricus TaxID=27687 RepID=A0A8C4SQR7_ERPCA|nr:histone H1-like [Erpetoichthys calabaricus]